MSIPKLLPVFTASLLFILACQKTGKTVSPASVSIVHAMAKGRTIVPVFGDGPLQNYAGARTVSYSSSQLYSIVSGVNPLLVVQNPDTTKPIFTGTLDVSAGNIYSLFLAGDTTKPDTLFVQDYIPLYSDSAAGVRFVNLSPASLPVNVNIKGNTPAQTEFTNLGYRQISDFKKYAATQNVTGNKYIFEIRNQANDSLLLTYTWNYARYKSQTLVFAGSVISGKPTALKIFPVNNY